MSGEEYYKALLNLQKESGRYTTGSALFFALKGNMELRKMVYMLSLFFLERKLGSCDSCYMDAYILLAKYDLSRARAKADCLFRLKEGKLLYGEPIVSNVNITNELALQKISENKDCLQWFAIVPPNVDALVEEYENSLRLRDDKSKDIQTIQNEKKVPKKANKRPKKSK